MSYTITTDIFCDICSNWVHGVSGETSSNVRAARTRAKEQGWICNRDGDFCSKSCAEYGAKRRSAAEELV